MLERILTIATGLNRRFPNGNQPFEIMTRLMEECGELAQQVNHFEGRGVKREKHGEPDKDKMAKEVMDVIRGAAQIALYYGLETELETAFERAYQGLKREGHVE